jgi:hypothetical protein
MEFGNVGTHRDFDANFRGMRLLKIILCQPPAYLSRLDAHHGIFSGSVHGRAVEELNSDGAFLQMFVMSLESVLDHIGEELLAALAAPEYMAV